MKRARPTLNNEIKYTRKRINIIIWIFYRKCTEHNHLTCWHRCVHSNKQPNVSKVKTNHSTTLRIKSEHLIELEIPVQMVIRNCVCARDDFILFHLLLFLLRVFFILLLFAIAVAAADDCVLFPPLDRVFVFLSLSLFYLHETCVRCCSLSVFITFHHHLCVTKLQKFLNSIPLFALSPLMFHVRSSGKC